MAVAAQAQLEKVRADSAKAVAQQHLDTEKMQKEDSFKHQELHFKTAIELQKLSQAQGDSPGQHAAHLGKLAATLMKAQSDSDAQDQKNQLDMAGAQQEQELAAQKAQSDIAIAQQKAAMAHSASMTGLASSHHLQERQLGQQHEQGIAKTLVGALGSDADRQSADRNAAADRQSQEKIARFKPRPK
jgi:hypothetical protein